MPGVLRMALMTLKSIESKIKVSTKRLTVILYTNYSRGILNFIYHIIPNSIHKNLMMPFRFL